jgi:hypothetical protein
MNEEEKWLESLFVNIFGEAVVNKVQKEWCPEHGLTPITDKHTCVICDSPTFDNAADYNAYMHS